MSTGGKVATKFRETFRVVQKDVLRWFPGHMGKGLKQMQQKLKNVDCIVEVHDARVPISGRYTDFKQTISGLKPHIFILNKKDLSDERFSKAIEERLHREGISNVLFTNLKDQTCSNMKKILPLAKNLIVNSNRYHRSEELSYEMMVIGVPNVGKSTLINRLRHTYLGKSRATQVGAIAGVTRSVLNRIKICEDPPFYLLDTPGILAPSIKDIESGLKLALIGCLQDHLVGPEIIADYLLFWLNKRKRFEYVEKLNIPEPMDDILEVLLATAVKLGKMKKVRTYDNQINVIPDIDIAANHFIKLFRNGDLGHICLDEDVLESQNT
ncbi:mitochondrial GTPase 1 [Orussus abietinus]|uniref:mitochondrial GTPase 1 n=1 Tax=Orussus abietinus TaxID=222816 RepID=UPI000625383A|nr:mitochondrial GTPase 1 [Orussus abietinus]